MDADALQTGTGNSAIESTVVAGIIAGMGILVLTASVLIALYCTIAIGMLIGAVTGIVVLQGASTLSVPRRRGFCGRVLRTWQTGVQRPKATDLCK